MFKICGLLSVLVAFTVAQDALVNYTVQSISETEIWEEGYGGIWDPYRKEYMFVDCFNATIASYNATTGVIKRAVLPGISFPTILIPLQNKPDHYLINSHKYVVEIQWDRVNTPQTIRPVFDVEPQPRFSANSLHMATASKNHQYFLGGTFRGAQCANIPAENASFYTYSTQYGVVRQDIPGLITVGGVALNAAGNLTYIVDICNAIVRQYDFDQNTGQISNGKIVYKYNLGMPPSCLLAIATDTSGKLYVGVWQKGLILQIDPTTGKVLQQIKIPVKNVASIAWGGTDHSVMYVTTSIPDFDITTGAISDYASTYTPNSGQTYGVYGLGVKGVVGHTINV